MPVCGWKKKAYLFFLSMVFPFNLFFKTNSTERDETVVKLFIGKQMEKEMYLIETFAFVVFVTVVFFLVWEKIHYFTVCS